MRDHRAVNMLTVVSGLAVIQRNDPHLISEEIRKELVACKIFLGYTIVTMFCMNTFSLKFG